MSDIMFQHWTEETSSEKQPRPATDLIDYLRRYRMRFTGRQPQRKTTPRPPTPPFKRKPFKTSSFPAQITRECGLCRNGPHPLYACLNFRDQSVEDRNNTAERLKVCVNCLSHAHFVQDCTSTRSCKYCGRKHHTMLHWQKSSGQGDFNRTPVQEPQPQQRAHTYLHCCQGSSSCVLGHL